MKIKKVFSLAFVTFFIVSCLILTGSAVAQDDESERHIYLPETDEEVFIDDPAAMEENAGIDYEADQQEVEEEYRYTYPEGEMDMDAPQDEEYPYEEDAEEELPLEE